MFLFVTFSPYNHNRFGLWEYLKTVSLLCNVRGKNNDRVRSVYHCHCQILIVL